MAEDVIAVMGHIGIPAAHVLGTSLGGMIAQELVLRFPRRVCSLVLAATSGGSVRRPPITARGTLTLAAAALLPARLRARLIARATLSLATRRKIAVSKACPAGWRMHTGTLAGLVGQAFALLAHRADSRLGQVAVPTLIIHGTSDELIDWCNALRLAELIPHARLETWQGAGHDLATEDPQRLAESVRRHVMGGGELQIED
jgi:pimeloyl-ACP methyl ester carboxylesterase